MLDRTENLFHIIQMKQYVAKAGHIFRALARRSRALGSCQAWVECPEPIVVSVEP